MVPGAAVVGVLAGSVVVGDNLGATLDGPRAEGRTEQLPGIVKELIGAGVAVLVTAGTAATLAAKRASATIPIVLVGVDDPVALGVVDSLMS